MNRARSPTETQEVVEEKKMEVPDTIRINWKMTSLHVFLHIGALIGIYLVLTTGDFRTVIFVTFYGVLGGLGLTAGCHRLWSHRSYKAKLPLRILLAIFSSIYHLKTIFVWVREHRIHHKYTGTNIDPHNINRGFFYAHMGNQMIGHHPDYKANINSVPMDDVWADPVVRFERKYHILMKTIFSYIIPTMIPMLLWNDSLFNSFIMGGPLRICVGLHSSFVVNSFSHRYGYKPYSKEITATESGVMSFASLGEGWHNFHHIFPTDYRTSEFGYINLTKVFIDVMAKLGLAYDLKTVPRNAIENSKLKTQTAESY